MSLRHHMSYAGSWLAPLLIIGVAVVGGVVLIGKFRSGEISFGNNSLEMEITNKEEELRELERDLSYVNERLTKREELNKQLQEYNTLQAGLKELTEANAELRGRLASLADGLEGTVEMFDAYQQRYRKHIREQAIGTKMDELKTLPGKVYQQVEIKSVGALGVNITHGNGSARIPFKELPKSMQRQFQFDEEEAEAQLKREAERRRLFRLAQAAALRAAEQPANDGEEERPRLSKAERERAMDRLKGAIRKIEGRIRVAQANLTVERKKTFSRAPQFRQELQELKAALKENEDRLRELKSMR